MVAAMNYDQLIQAMFPKLQLNRNDKKKIVFSQLIHLK